MLGYIFIAGSVYMCVADITPDPAQKKSCTDGQCLESQSAMNAKNTDTSALVNVNCGKAVL